jgi:hypothetical protein
VQGIFIWLVDPNFCLQHPNFDWFTHYFVAICLNSLVPFMHVTKVMYSHSSVVKGEKSQCMLYHDMYLCPWARELWADSMFVCNLLGAWFLRIDVVHQTLMNESIAFHKPTSHKMKGHSVSQTKLLSQSLLAVELDTCELRRGRGDLSAARGFPSRHAWVGDDGLNVASFLSFCWNCAA